MGSNSGLLLMGGCGTGKTHLAVAALRKIVLRGHSGIFYDYRELLKEIQHSYNSESQTTELEVLEPVLTTELLLIDDLASTKASDWVRETVGHILNTRYNEHRVTILTTNFLDLPKRSGSDDTAGPNGKATLSDTKWNRPRFRLATGQTIAAHSEDTLSERLGERIRSRLYEMCRTIELFAPDYRCVVRQAGRIRS